MKKTIATIAAAGYLFTASPAFAQADLQGMHQENVKRWTEGHEVPEIPSLDDLAWDKRMPILEETAKETDNPLGQLLWKANEMRDRIDDGKYNPIGWIHELSVEVAKEERDFFHGNEFLDSLYLLPNNDSLKLVEKLAEKYPQQKAMMQYVKHFAFDSTDTIPNDYLWQLRPKKAGASGMKQLYERAHERIKDMLGVKTSLLPEYRAKLGAAREKDRMFITGLYAIEKRLDKCLDTCPPEELQTLLFDYGILAQARQEYVRSVFDKGVEKLTSKDLQLK